MRTRIALLVLFAFVISAGAGFGASVYHRQYYMSPTDRVTIDSLDLWCVVGPPDASLGVLETMACGNNSSGTGPYIRVNASRITIAASNGRTLFTVRRSR